MQLHHGVERSAQLLGGVELGDGRLLERDLAAHVLGQVVVDHDAHRHALGLQVGELELGVLEVPDGLAEGLAVLHVVDGVLQAGLEHGRGAQRDREALLRQLFHQRVHALALAAEDVAGGNAHVVEEELGGVGGMLADLVELAAAAEARAVGLDEDQAHRLGAGLGGIGLGDQDDQVAVQAVADEGLAAVDDVLVAVTDRGGADVLQVAAGARLGHRDGEDGLAGGAARQPLRLLLLGAEPVDVGRDDVGVQPEAHAGDAQPAHLFGEHRRVAVVAAAAAVFLGQRGAKQAFLAGLEPQLARHAARLVPGVHVGHALALQEAAHRGAELFMVVAIDGAGDLHRGSSGSAGGRAADGRPVPGKKARFSLIAAGGSN